MGKSVPAPDNIEIHLQMPLNRNVNGERTDKCNDEVSQNSRPKNLHQFRQIKSRNIENNTVHAKQHPIRPFVNLSKKQNQIRRILRYVLTTTAKSYH